MQRIIKVDDQVLVDIYTGWPLQVGEFRKSHSGEIYEVTGGRPPQHPGSTGRIWVRGAEYFPGVLDAKWVREDENDLQRCSKFTLDGVSLMQRIGGGFASALAKAYFSADAGNRRKILDAFGDVILRHALLAKLEQSQEDCHASSL